MASVDSYNRQLGLLSELSREIEGLQHKIDQDRSDYQSQIGSLEANGFMGEYVERLENRYKVFSRLVDEMQNYLNGCRNNIETKHKVVIENRLRAQEIADRQSGG